MEQAYSLDIRDGILYLIFQKKPTAAEVRRVIDQAQTLGKIRMRLWFFPDNCAFTVEELIEITDYGKKVWTLPSRAAVIGSTKFKENLNQMQVVNPEKNDFKTRVFQREEDAINWLKYGG